MGETLDPGSTITESHARSSVVIVLVADWTGHRWTLERDESIARTFGDRDLEFPGVNRPARWERFIETFAGGGTRSLFRTGGMNEQR
jgi:hypothetical protein